MSVSATRTTMAGRISRNMTRSPSGEMQGRNDNVDGLDADERDDDAADAVDPKIAAEQRAGADRAITHPFEGQWDERDNDQRIEDNGGEDCALRRLQMHNVERLQLRIERDEHCRNDREIFRHV